MSEALKFDAIVVGAGQAGALSISDLGLDWLPRVLDVIYP